MEHISVSGHEPLVVEECDLAVRQLVGRFQEGGASGGHLLLEIPGDIALLHLDVIDDLTIEKVVGGCRKVVGAGGHFLLEVLGDIALLLLDSRTISISVVVKT